MWTFKEIDDNPTGFIIIDEKDTAIACVYDRDFARTITERFNNLVHSCQTAMELIKDREQTIDLYKNKIAQINGIIHE